MSSKVAYTCFSTDVIHAGHINIINEAKKYGRVVVGCLSDSEAIRYNRFPTICIRILKVLTKSLCKMI